MDYAPTSMGVPPSDFDASADALYAAPLRAFVPERKRLADALRAAGQRKEAAAFLKLPRPSLSAWVVNQLFRRQRADVDALFEASARIRNVAEERIRRKAKSPVQPDALGNVDLGQEL